MPSDTGRPGPPLGGGRSGVGLQLAIDGSGLERPRAGVGVYTSQIIHAMSVDRPDCRMVVYGPAGGFTSVPDATYRLMPQARFIGRHLQWPAAIRRLKPNAYFGPAGALPLGSVVSFGDHDPRPRDLH